MTGLRLILTWPVLFFLCTAAVAQPSFKMSNASTNECEGILQDSENGMLPDTYDNNENYTFKICVPGGEKIVFTFAKFCTEEKLDYLRFFDGPDTLSPLIGGPFSGTVLPPSITATSGCMTINFISDANIQCVGWLGSWKVEIDDPVPPQMMVVGTVPCESSSLKLKLSQQVSCDSIYPGAFLIYGPQSPDVIAATPVGCTNGKTDEVLLTFSPEIKVNGNYTVNFTTTFLDVCNKPHVLTASTNFNVSGCPLYVELVPENNKKKVCPGECLKLYANISGGDPSSYSIKWSDASFPNSAVVDICAPPLTYSVTVTDGIGSKAAVASFTFELHTPPVINWPLDLTICQSEPAFYLSAVPSGGSWNCNGIYDKQETPGYYEPWRIWQGQDLIIYTDKNGCKDTVDITVKPISVYHDDASCPGAPPFKVTGGTPAGGTWSGQNITPTGIFDPAASGTYYITYTALNGCSQTKKVNVADLKMPDDVTICSSKSAFSIPVTPWGGYWSPSPGLDVNWGWFSPSDALPGENKLYYHIQGCSDSMSIYIVPVDAKYDFVACTNNGPFIVPGAWGPAGGVWSGPGIIDSLTGMFDPALLNDGADIKLVYTVNGCSDTRKVYVRNTIIKEKNVVSFCPYDDVYKILNADFNVSPNGGSWSGPGVYYVYIKDKDPKNGYYFDPKLANSGPVPLVYTANGCTDTMYFKVNSLPVLDTINLCIEETPIKLNASQSVATWSGNGIINAFGGIFDPKVAGTGQHTITMTSTDGCVNTGIINVIPFQKVVLSGLASSYCYIDTTININFSPAGGTLLVDGLPQTTFNPVVAGPGVHTISYNYGTGKCADSKSLVVNVGPPVTVELAFASDSICRGESSKISATGSGGSSFGNFNYSWNNGIGFGQTQFVFPQSTTLYTVTVSDGCSDPVTADVLVYVHPDFTVNRTYGPSVCFGDTTFTTLSAVPASTYSYHWLTNPLFSGDSYTGPPSTYLVKVVNETTGCSQEESVDLKGYPLIQANFTIPPVPDCFSSLDASINILDHSVGGVSGYWEFGDGTVMDYNPQAGNLNHSYTGAGDYVLKLHIENEGGCISEDSLQFCIINEETIYAPNAFTPDGDNLNDKFQFAGLGIREIKWQVFNRWGEQVFEGNSMDDAWDGYKNNKLVPLGVYTYIAVYKSELTNQEKILKGLVTVIY